MKWKHAFTITVICGVLLALIYLQFRHWRSFDWQQFWKLAEERKISGGFWPLSA